MLMKFQPLCCIKFQTDCEAQAEGMGGCEGEGKASFLRSHTVAEELVHEHDIPTVCLFQEKTGRFCIAINTLALSVFLSFVQSHWHKEFQ